MRLLASIVILAGAISALPIDSTLSASADTSISHSTTAQESTANPTTNQEKDTAGSYGPPGGSYGPPGGGYGYGPPPTPFPFQGGGYTPGQYTPPPPPRGYGNTYSSPAPGPGIAGGLGSIANGVGQLIGGTTGALVGGISGEFLHGIKEGRGYRKVKRESEASASLLLGVGRRVAGWLGDKE